MHPKLLLGRTEVKSLLALEPSEGMRAGFKQSVIDQLPVDFPIKVDVQPGTFTHSNERDSSKDLIVIAQAGF